MKFKAKVFLDRACQKPALGPGGRELVFYSNSSNALVSAVNHAKPGQFIRLEEYGPISSMVISFEDYHNET